MNKKLLIRLFAISLLLATIAEVMLHSSVAKAQADGIIVDGEDYISTITNEYSAGLVDITDEVTSRVAVEYGDFGSRLGLNRSSGLDQAASALSSRATVEYADFAFVYESQRSDALSQAATTVTSRIVVEYADFIFGVSLGPDPVELIPEFPSLLILPLLIIATLLAVTAYKGKFRTRSEYGKLAQHT